MLKKLLTVAATAGMFTAVMAQEAPKADAKADAKKEDKLLPLMTMEQAFVKTLQTRTLLAKYISEQATAYKDADEAKKAEIEKNVAAARTRLSEINTYMDVIYGLGGQRVYEYNQVTSEIFLRVGNVSEVFTRAIAARDSLAKQIAANKELIDKETDAEKKKQFENAQKAIISRYALIVNALYNVFQVHPNRNYQFDAASRTLFLKTNDEEVNKLKLQLEEAKKKQEAKAAQEKK